MEVFPVLEHAPHGLLEGCRVQLAAIEGHQGGMITAGVGGAITGRGGNCLVVDDAIKNAQEAASQAAHPDEGTRSWYVAVVWEAAKRAAARGE